MIPHFKAHTHIRSDKQHFDIKQASMIVQEKEPLSAVKGANRKRFAPFFYT